MSKISSNDLVLAALTGVLYPLTFMIPYTGLLAWVLLIPLFWAIENKSASDAFKLGLLAGLVSNLAGTYWLIGTLSRFGGFPILVSVLFIIFLSAFSGLSYALFSYIVTKLGFLRKPGVVSALLVAAVWTSVEYLFPFLFPYGIANKILAKNTNKPLSQVEKDTDRDFYMSADEAKKYGIVDDIYK